jgi:hypothetical protein
MKFLTAICVAILAMGVHAEDSGSLLDRTRALETESAALLYDHHLFEEELVSPESDRMVVFFSMPHGARVILTWLNLYLDGKLVLTHPFGVDELMLLQGRSSQLLFLARIPPGPHSLKAEVQAMQGQVKPMKASYAFVKGKKAKFLELQFGGYPVREFEVVEW